jgi:hypothetical protein
MSFLYTVPSLRYFITETKMPHDNLSSSNRPAWAVVHVERERERASSEARSLEMAY